MTEPNSDIEWVVIKRTNTKPHLEIGQLVHENGITDLTLPDIGKELIDVGVYLQRAELVVNESDENVGAGQS